MNRKSQIVSLKGVKTEINLNKPNAEFQNEHNPLKKHYCWIFRRIETKQADLLGCKLV